MHRTRLAAQFADAGRQASAEDGNTISTTNLPEEQIIVRIITTLTSTQPLNRPSKVRCNDSDNVKDNDGIEHDDDDSAGDDDDQDDDEQLCGHLRSHDLGVGPLSLFHNFFTSLQLAAAVNM